MAKNCFALGNGTVITFTGADRVRVFNNLCTQDIRKGIVGSCAETFVTDVKGKTFGHGTAVFLEDEALFVTVPSQAERLVPHFDRYIIREDAQIHDDSQVFRLWLVRTSEAAAEALSLDVPAILTNGDVSRHTVVGDTAIFVKTPWIGASSIVVLTKSNSEARDLERRLELCSEPSSLATRKGWEFDRIAAFWPWYGVDCDEKNLPQELSRDALAISFNKGCYLGQETVARLDALGQVQKRMVQLSFDSDPQIVTPFRIEVDSKDVGVITSIAHSNSEGRCLALAMIKRSHFNVGTEMNVNGTRGTVVR
jgi:tRNA-modifying protein YgfZ